MGEEKENFKKKVARSREPVARIGDTTGLWVFFTHPL
jgi:hypothetical protein